MKWDTIKKEVADGVASRLAQVRRWEDAAKMLADIAVSATPGLSPADYAEKAREAIMAWDVRAADRLRDLFPQEWPRRMRGNLCAEPDGKGGWDIWRRDNDNRLHP